MTATDIIVIEVAGVHSVPNTTRIIRQTRKLKVVNITDSLDFTKFKTEVLQYIGETGNYPIKYVNANGDQVLIETEEQFKKFIKVAKKFFSRAQVLKVVVDMRNEHAVFTESREMCPEKAKKHTDLKKKHSDGTVIRGVKATSVNIRAKPLLQQLANMPTIMSDGSTSKQCACSDSPPTWFFIYMKKLKEEILQEVKEIIKVEKVKKEIKQEKKPRTRCVKRQEDELRDNPQNGVEQRNMKLLRKIEKLHRKEKKLETKLDQRIEKMETRKKRMLERTPCPRNGKHKLSEESGSEGYGPVALPNWLSGVPVTKLLPIHVLPQQVFSRTWEVLNNGIVPWTDTTELREIFWHPNGLLPEKTIVKCPPLKSGEKGSITVTFTAPDSPGIYESCWNFFHMGEIFGCGVACTVIVDAGEDNSDPNTFAEIVEKKFEEVTRKIKKLKLENDEEYNSSSDSDSIVTDSDDSGSFVVVDMPLQHAEDSQDDFQRVMQEEIRRRKMVFKSHKAVKENQDVDQDQNADINEEHSGLHPNVNKIFQVGNEITDNVSNVKENNKNVYVVDRCGIITIPASAQQAETASCYTLSTASSCVDVTASSPLYPKLELLSQKNSSTAPSCPDCHTQVEGNEFLSCPNDTGVQFANIQHERIGSGVYNAISETQNSNMEKMSPAAAKPAEQESTEHPEQIVPILPEALMNGAVNVAQSAYSVACNVLNTLRAKAESDTNDSDQQFKTNMSLLSEMGFTNTVCNAVLLKYYNNDLEKVIAAILSGGRVEQIPK